MPWAFETSNYIPSGTPSNPSQTVLPSRGHVFKYRSLWVPFSFKPSQWLNGRALTQHLRGYKLILKTLVNKQINNLSIITGEAFSGFCFLLLRTVLKTFLMYCRSWKKISREAWLMTLEFQSMMVDKALWSSSVRQKGTGSGNRKQQQAQRHAITLRCPTTEVKFAQVPPANGCTTSQIRPTAGEQVLGEALGEHL